MGTLVFQATLGGAVNIIGPNIANTINFTLPSADGTSGQTWTTNGSGLLTFGTLGVAGGGTGLTTLATGSLSYGAGTSAFSTLAIGTAGQILTVNSGATAPQWSTLTGVAVTTFSAGTTGFTPSSATAGAITLSGTLVAANGGTGQSSYAVGDLLYASTTTALSKLADVATGNALISGGVGVAPSWGKIGLTTHVSGTLPTANGGTNLTSFTSGGVVYASSTSALATGSTLNFNGTSLAVGDSPSAADGSRFYVYGNIPASTQLGIKIAGNANAYTQQAIRFYDSYFEAYAGYIGFTTNSLTFGQGTTEGMRLTSTGLGIGTSSPYAKVESTQATGGYGGWKYALGLNATDFPAMRFLATTGNTGNLIAHEAGSLVFLTGTTATTAGTERLRLSSAGNLGLGVTPSAWSAYKAIQTSGASFIGYSDGASNNQAMVVANAFYDSTDNWKYIYTDNATRYRQFDGEHQWSTAASGTAGTNVSFTQAMTLDASGNLGVGTTSPSARFSAAITAAQNTNTQVFTATDSTYCDFNVYLNRVTTLATSSAVIDTSAGILALKTSNTERARIDASGNLLVGTTTQFSGTARLSITATTGAQNVLQTRPTTNITYYPALFENSSGTTVGYIQSTSAATAYVTTSDYRLKNSIAPITGALNKVSQLKPCTYKWNADGSDGEGFIAHELAEVVPQCVSGGKDAVDEEGNPKYQGIDTSFLVATLTAAIQEQQAIIESLKARLDAANL